MLKKKKQQFLVGLSTDRQDDSGRDIKNKYTTFNTKKQKNGREKQEQW